MAIFALTTKLVPVVKENVAFLLKLFLTTNREKRQYRLSSNNRSLVKTSLLKSTLHTFQTEMEISFVKIEREEGSIPRKFNIQDVPE